jgi:hypothetical protein
MNGVRFLVRTRPAATPMLVPVPKTAARAPPAHPSGTPAYISPAPASRATQPLLDIGRAPQSPAPDRAAAAPAARTAPRAPASADAATADRKDQHADGRDDKADKADASAGGDRKADGAARGRNGASAERADASGGRGGRAGASERSRREEDEGDLDLPESEPVPEPVVGPAALARSALLLPAPGAPFDAPTSLDLEPEHRANAKQEPPTPEVQRYRGVFAEAIAAARRLHDDLLTQASRFAAAATAAEEARADGRQSGLDADLERLGSGLAHARAGLAQSADTVLALLDARAGTARDAIRSAAARAYAVLRAREIELRPLLNGARDKRDKVLKEADDGQAQVRTDGLGAMVELWKLGMEAEKRFADDEDKMKSATNEAIATRLPERTGRSIAGFGKEMWAELTLLQTTFATLRPDFTEAFSSFELMMDNVTTLGPAAVGRATKAALKKLDRGERRLRQTVLAAQASTEAALIRQHDAGRAQMIEAAAGRARSEASAADQRARRDIEAAEGLAGGQSKAVRAIIANMARERHRPMADFARAAIGAAGGLSRRLEEMSAEQLPRLAATAADGRRRLDRQSQGTSAQMSRSTEAMATRLDEAATQAGDRIEEQVDQGTAEFIKFPDPVVESIAAYLPPVGKKLTQEFAKLDEMIAATGARVRQALGKEEVPKEGAGDKGAKDKAAPALKLPEPPPRQTPTEFHKDAADVVADATRDHKVASLISLSQEEVPKKLTQKAADIHAALSAFSTNVETVMAALRTTTARQGVAITQFYASEFGRDIEWHICMELPKTFSSYYTNTRNVEAAIDYLHGRNAHAALLEMQVAVHLWNDEARVERVQRSLTPAQMKELNGYTAEIEDIRDDLGGVHRQVFVALQEANVGEANALRLKTDIDTARKKHGDEGADASVDRIVEWGERAGSDPIAGADPLGLDDPDVRAERQEQRWLETQQAFGKLAPVDDKAALKDDKGNPLPGAAIYAYATNTRYYLKFIPDKYQVIPGLYGINGHFEIADDPVSKQQKRLVENVLRYGADSDQVAGARLAVEMKRGKAKLDRLDLATHDESYEAREGETEDQRVKRRESEQADRVAKGKRKERHEAVLMLYDQYSKEDEARPGETVRPASDPNEVKQRLGARVLSQFVGDPSAYLYAKSMIDSPKPTDQAQAAFHYALKHESATKETMVRLFGRMNRREIDEEVAKYDADRGSGPSLYAKLGIRGQKKHWMLRLPGEEPLLEGDEANEVELKSIGVPRNDSERADVALLSAEQQIRDSGWLGRLLAHEAYSRLLRNRERLEQLAGKKLTGFGDEGQLMLGPVGQAGPLGHFDEAGKFAPAMAGTADAHALDMAMHLTHLSAEGYRQAVDSIAAMVTTGLMIIAAVVTTVLTGGAAASIWIPVLVTAGAGLVGIGLSAAIKGDRYTTAEMQRDLVVTMVQAATAGLGAAAGVALRGGMPALRAVGSRMVLSEKVLERFLQVSGRGALRQSLTLAEEGLIAGGSNMLNSAAAAAADPDTRRRGASGDEAFNAGMRGFFGGVLGAAVMKPIMGVGTKIGQPQTFAGQATRRAFGTAASNVATRGEEIAWERQRGQVLTIDETIDELRTSGLQGLAQGLAEAHAGERADRWREARAEKRRATAAARIAAEAQTPARATHEAAYWGAAGRPAATTPRPATEPAAIRPGEGAPVRVDADAVAHTAQVGDALPPGIRANAETALESAVPRSTAPPPEAVPLPRLAEAPLPRADEAPAAPGMPQQRGDGEGPSGPGPRPGPEDESAQRGARPRAGEEESGRRAVAPRSEEERRALVPDFDDEPTNPRARIPAEMARLRRRAMAWLSDLGGRAIERLRYTIIGGIIRSKLAPKWLREFVLRFVPLVDLPDTSVMLDPHPTSQDNAYANYQRMLDESPAREAAIYRNTETGAYIVIQGNEMSVAVHRPAEGPGEGPAPAGGRQQRWKEILDGNDVGRWELEAHFHPYDPRTGRTGLGQRLPSGMDADFGVMTQESAAAGGAPRSSRIHFKDRGAWNYTDFGFDPNSTRGRFWIEIPDLVNGQRQRHEFAKFEDYAAFYKFATGRELLGGTVPSTSGVAPNVEPPGGARGARPPPGREAPTGVRGARPEPGVGPSARGVPPAPSVESPSGLHGAAAAVEGSMFVAEAPLHRQDPNEVKRLVGADVEGVKALMREVLPEKEGIVVNYRKEDNSFLISYPKGKDREWVRIRIEAVDPSQLTPVDGRIPPAQYERHAGAKAGVKLTDADVVYRVRVSDKTDPLNVAPAVAHEIAEIHRAESERRAAGRKVKVEPSRPDALTPTSLAKELSTHDIGRLEQLRVRMDQLAAHQLEMGFEQPMAQALREDVHALIGALGLATADANGERRLALIMADPHLSQETRLAVSRAVGDVRVEAMTRAQAQAAAEPLARAAEAARAAPPGTQRQAYEAAYSEARRQERNADFIKQTRAESEAVTRAVERVREADPANGASADKLLKLDPGGVRAVLSSETVASQRRALIDLAARLRAHGMTAPEIGSHIAALKSLLEKGGLRAALQHERRLAAHAVVLGSFDPILASYVRKSPELSALLAANPDYLRYRFERHRMRNPGLDASQKSLDGFLLHVKTEHQPQHVKPALGEISAIHHLAETDGMTGVLRGGPGTGEGSHAPNAPGFDVVGFVPTPENQPRSPKVPVILADDKSHDVASLSEASAVVEKLVKNIAVESGRQERALQAQIDAGHTPDPDHVAAVKQIRAAYDALTAIENDARFKGRPDRFIDPDYIAAVRVALRKQRIRIIITSTLGNVAKLSKQLQDYGIELR